MLYREAHSARVYAIDFRERAPIQAKESMFVDKRGKLIPDKSTLGIHSVAVPGLVAGLLDIHKRFGHLPLEVLMAPAIDLAQKGIVVYPDLAEALESQRQNLAKFEASKKIFLKLDGSPQRLYAAHLKR